MFLKYFSNGLKRRAVFAQRLNLSFERHQLCKAGAPDWLVCLRGECQRMANFVDGCCVAHPAIDMPSECSFTCVDRSRSAATKVAA